MGRGRLAWGLFGATVVAVAFVAWFPGYRLQREIAAARAEGVPLEVADLRRLFPKAAPEENAAPLVVRAFSLGRAFERRNGSLDVAASNALMGRATAKDRARLREVFGKNPALLDRWRTASERPKLDYDRPWEKPDQVNGNGIPYLLWGARRLVAAAVVGLDAEANLRAAARLASLVRGQPMVSDVLVGNVFAAQVLRAAARLGLAREADASLGPSVDARRSLYPKPSDAMILLREYDAPPPGLSGTALWLRRLRFWRPDPILRGVRAWRALWRELPRDGTDYAGVAAALDRRMPEIQAALVAPGFGPFSPPDAKVEGDRVRAFAQFEAEREKIR